MPVKQLVFYDGRLRCDLKRKGRNANAEGEDTMKNDKRIKNILCVDLEEWYNSNLETPPIDFQPESRVEMNTWKLLSLFEEYQAKATFFVVGDVAEKHPNLIREIYKRGHEIGCHSEKHRLVYQLSRKEFLEDTHCAKCRLEEIIGVPVVSYRAPSWSITEKSFWALEVLEREGFRFDSSIFPFKNFLYGVKNAPRFPYRTKKYNVNSNLMEFPPSTIRVLRKNIPFSGGFYLRALPVLFVAMCIRILNKQGHPAVMYIHPWEIDPDTPRLSLNLRDRLIQYWGIRINKKKLVYLLKRFSFTSLLEKATLSDK